MAIEWNTVSNSPLFTTKRQLFAFKSESQVLEPVNTVVGGYYEDHQQLGSSDPVPTLFRRRPNNVERSVSTFPETLQLPY